MWKVEFYNLDSWQDQFFGKNFKNVIIGDDSGDSIIFIASEEGAKKMAELVEHANQYLEEEKMAEEIVAISKNEYDQLKSDALFLDCLRAVGVDNWDGYGEAWQEFRKAKEEEE